MSQRLPITKMINSPATNRQYNTPEQLLAFARHSLDGHLEVKGNIFYSGFDSYLSGRVMFLGYNPGGSGKETLRTRLDSLYTTSRNDFVSEYWGDWKTKHNVLQRRIQHLFQSVGLNLPEVFTTNLYFPHSVSVEAFHDVKEQPPEQLHALKRACWTVVEHFLHAVPANVIVCNGTQTLNELLYWMDPKAAAESKAYYAAEPVTLPARPRAPRFTRQSFGGRERLLIGLPHQSRFSLAKHPHEIDAIRELIDAELKR